MVVYCLLPRPVHIIAHQMDSIEMFADLCNIITIFNGRFIGKNSSSQLPAIRFECFPQFLYKSCEPLLVSTGPIMSWILIV